jgi:hypothetical protein
MIDVQELLERADDFMGDELLVEGLSPQAAARLAQLGVAAGAAAGTHAVGRSVSKSVEKGGKSKQSRNIQRLKDRHGITAKSFIPRNEYEAKKLKRRSTIGHVGHGALRGLSPFGLANITRYAHKVKAANKGQYRNKEY